MSQQLKEQLVEFDSSTGRVLRPPRHVFVELSSRCNLACVHCPKDFGAEHDHPKLDMPLHVLRAASPWLQQARFVNLNSIGESLLSEHFDEALAICSQGSAEVSFNTNGLLLSEARCRHIVASKVHSVTISIDGIESNEPIRGVSYETIKTRLLRLAEAKRNAGSTLPHIAVAFTLMRRNAEELPRLAADLVKAADLHAIHVQPLVIYYESLRQENPYGDPVAIAAAREARRITEAAGSHFVLYRSTLEDDERNRSPGTGQLGQASSRFGCIDPFYEAKIRSTGEVMACSYGLLPDLKVQDHSLEDIWNHQWYRNLRTDLANGRFVGRCGTCPYVKGCEAHQVDPVRPGVRHSQESRFFANGYTSGQRPSAST
jgi:MoaA/NifB/PqqE/SkfB family radical SAM enzyme